MPQLELDCGQDAAQLVKLAIRRLAGRTGELVCKPFAANSTVCNQLLANADGQRHLGAASKLSLSCHQSNQQQPKHQLTTSLFASSASFASFAAHRSRPKRVRPEQGCFWLHQDHLAAWRAPVAEPAWFWFWLALGAAALVNRRGLRNKSGSISGELKRTDRRARSPLRHLAPARWHQLFWSPKAEPSALLQLGFVSSIVSRPVECSVGLLARPVGGVWCRRQANQLASNCKLT